MKNAENNPRHIVVHHSGIFSAGPQLSLIERLHRARRFPRSALGYHVGYHFLIEKDGAVIQTREESEGGAHAVGQNFSSLGICLCGNFDTEQPSEAQVRGLGALLRELVERHGIEPSDILPHRACNERTHCFGLKLPRGWAQQVYQKVLTSRRPFL